MALQSTVNAARSTDCRDRGGRYTIAAHRQTSRASLLEAGASVPQPPPNRGGSLIFGLASGVIAPGTSIETRWAKGHSEAIANAVTVQGGSQ